MRRRSVFLLACFGLAVLLPLGAEVLELELDDADGVVLWAPEFEALVGAASRVPPGGPGTVAAAKAAPTVAYVIDWTDHQSTVAIEDGSGLRRRAWVATRFPANGPVAVAYPGMAYLDAAGVLHVDCREVLISGPQKHQWSPDSFAINPDGSVRIVDDAARGNPGQVLEKVEPKPQQLPRYRQLLLFARSQVLGRL